MLGNPAISAARSDGEPLLRGGIRLGGCGEHGLPGTACLAGCRVGYVPEVEALHDGLRRLSLEAVPAVLRVEAQASTW